MTKSDTGPFALVPVWVLESEISAQAVRIYAIHSDFADRQGAHFHSRRKIAERARCSVDAVDRAHGELVKIGALEIQARRDETSPRQTSNRYRIIRVIHTPAAQMRLGGRENAALPRRVDAAPVTRPSYEPLQVEPLSPEEKAKGLAQVRRLRNRDSATG